MTVFKVAEIPEFQCRAIRREARYYQPMLKNKSASIFSNQLPFDAGVDSIFE